MDLINFFVQSNSKSILHNEIFFHLSILIQYPLIMCIACEKGRSCTFQSINIFINLQNTWYSIFNLFHICLTLFLTYNVLWYEFLNIIFMNRSCILYSIFSFCNNSCNFYPTVLETVYVLADSKAIDLQFFFSFCRFSHFRYLFLSNLEELMSP